MTAPVIERMRAYYARREPKAVEGARQRYGILQQSLARLNAAGARIVLGADTGLEDHHFGFAEQLELQAMVEAGHDAGPGDCRRHRPRRRVRRAAATPAC